MLTVNAIGQWHHWRSPGHEEQPSKDHFVSVTENISAISHRYTKCGSCYLAYLTHVQADAHRQAHEETVRDL